ncbi:MAG: hypothetical protein ACR2PL_07735 [Dehalococcoidia bacterium]
MRMLSYPAIRSAGHFPRGLTIRSFREVSQAWIAEQVVSLMIMALALIARLSVGPITIDDAFITFRYARNLAEGHGFVYNLGERVLGPPTPLDTMLLAILYRLGLHDLPHVALTVNAAADAVTAIVLIRLALHLGLGRWWAGLIGFLFALAPLSVAFAAGGMESSLFTLLVVAAVAADVRNRTCLAGVLAGLAILTRPEGAVLAGLIIGRHLLNRHLPPRSTIIAFGLVLLPWVLFSSWYFGGPIPESIMAKASHYQADPLFNIVTLIGNLGAPGFNSDAFNAPHGHLLILGSLLLGTFSLGLTCSQARTLIRYGVRHPSTCSLVVFAPLLMLAYILEGFKSAHIFPWYLVPFVPFCVFGAVAIWRLAARRLPLPLQMFGTMVLVAWVLLGFNLGSVSNRAVLAPRGLNLSREEAYTKAAGLLSARVPSRAVVALPEIGAFGYYSQSRILDTAGLVSPIAAKFYPLPAGFRSDITAPPELIRLEQPEYLVGLDRFLPGQLQTADWFQRDYRLLTSYDAQIWEGNQVLVYERVNR